MSSAKPWFLGKWRGGVESLTIFGNPADGFVANECRFCSVALDRYFYVD
jgi:hypothetical protein